MGGKAKMSDNLSCGEVSHIWMGYQYETLHRCGIIHFLQHVDDAEVKKLLEEGLELTNRRVEQMSRLYKKYDQLLPKGFSVEDDVNLEAPRLFSDELYLHFMISTVQLELVNYTLGYRDAMNDDVLKIYQQMIKDSLGLEFKAKMLAKKKGIFISVPIIPKQSENELVQSDSFLSGWFGDKRPLIGTEIAQLVLHSKRNTLGQAVITAFSQVAKAKEVREFFIRGREIAKKNVEVLTKKLHEDFLPSSAVFLADEVSESGISPFSDKLMTVFITTLITAGLGGYGLSLAMSPRRDLSVQYSRLIVEIAKYSEDGIKLLIKNGWMEKPPMASNRRDLAK